MVETGDLGKDKVKTVTGNLEMEVDLGLEQ
jgi:hypothetical protein